MVSPSDAVSSSSSSSSLNPIHALFNSTADKRIAHLNRVLSTASGVDSTLCFLGYGLIFVSSQLSRLSTLDIASFAEKLSIQTPKSVGAKAAVQLGELATATKVLGGICSDVRTFMRLFGLLKIWAGAKGLYYTPPKDGVLKALGWGQLSSMAAYLLLENQLYLASKGIVKGLTPATMGQRMRAAVWVFFAYLMLDLVRLHRITVLREKKRLTGAALEKEEKIKLQDEDRAWWRSLQVDLAYSPLCFHWAAPAGLVGDDVVGFLGAVAGFAGFREALRVTA